MGGTVDLVLFFAQLGIALLGGAWIAFWQSGEHEWRYVALGWLACAAWAAALYWIALRLGLDGPAGATVALMLPAALLGGLLGAIAGLLWYREF